MATVDKVRAIDEIRELWDARDIKRILSGKTVSDKDKLYAYLRIMDFLAPKQQATPPDSGKREKDEKELMIDNLFNDIIK